MFAPNFKSLGQVVAEKSLSLQTDKHTLNIMTEKAKSIYPLYISYTGGIMNTRMSVIRHVFGIILKKKII